MKVCLITGEYPPMRGGIADYTQRLAGCLVDAGVSVLVLTSQQTQSPQAVKHPEETRIYATIRTWGFGAWPSIARLIRGEAIDIAHIQYQTAAFGMHPAINLLPFWVRFRVPGCRVVTTMHDFRVPYLFPKAGHLRSWMNQALMRGSHAVVLTNQDDLALSQMSGASRPRLIPLGNNLPPALPASYDRSHWRAQHGLGQQDFVLAFFGLLNHSKGVDTLLEALGLLQKASGNFKLLMIGAAAGDSDPTNIAYRQGILRRVRALGLEDSVHWTGYVAPEAVSMALAASDACLLPYADGASFRRTSLITALAHGLPVVTTQPEETEQELIRCTVEGPALRSGENCLLVPPKDAGALAKAVQLLAATPELRARLAQAACQVAQAFSWEEVTSRTLTLYRDVLADRNP